MTICRMLILSGVLVLSAGMIVADTIPAGDGGGFKLISGGTGSVDITGSPGTIVNGQLEGSCSFSNDTTVPNCVVLDNNITGQTITSLELTINTDNPAQDFACDTGGFFLNCTITGGTDPGGETPITFNLFGIGAPAGCPAPGDSDGPDGDNDCDDFSPGGATGIPVGTDVVSMQIYSFNCVPGTFGCGYATGPIAPPILGFGSVPEPATFLMLFPVAVVTIAGFKLRRRRRALP